MKTRACLPPRASWLRLGAPPCAVGLCIIATMLGATPAAAATAYPVTNLQGFNDPTAVAVNPYWHTAYVVNNAADNVSVLSETGTSPTGTVTATVPVGHDPRAVAVDAPIGDDVGTSAPSSNNVYVANYRDGTVSVINRADTHGDPGVIATIGGFDFPDAVAVDPDTHNVYVGNEGNDTVSVIDESGDARSGTVTATIGLSATVNGGEGGGHLALAVDPGRAVYVASPDEATVYVIDESGDSHNGTVTAEIAVDDEPDSIAVDPSNHAVYVSCGGNNFDFDGSLVVIDESGDANNGTITDDIEVGQTPSGVAVDPATDNVYVTNTSDGTVSVIDPTGSVIATVSGFAHSLNGGGPGAVAVDPMGWWGWPTPSHNIFVADYDNNTVEVISPEVSPQIAGGYVLYASAGTPYDDQLAVTGSPSPTVTTPGAPPPGLTLSPQGELSGTPTTPGTYQLPVSASNILPPAASTTYTVVVTETGPTINSTGAVAYVGQGFSYQIPVTGVPAPTVQLTGTLPAGIVWSAADHTLSGTPAAGTAGNYSLELKATGADTAYGTFTLTVRVPPPSLRPPPPPPGGCGSHLCQ